MAYLVRVFDSIPTLTMMVILLILLLMLLLLMLFILQVPLCDLLY